MIPFNRSASLLARARTTSCSPNSATLAVTARRRSGRGSAVQADAARLHHDELAVLRHQTHGDQRREETGNRDDVVHVLRCLIVEKPQQHRRRGGSSEQLVRQVDERRDVEDPERGKDREREDPHVLLSPCSRSRIFVPGTPYLGMLKRNPAPDDRGVASTSSDASLGLARRTDQAISSGRSVERARQSNRTTPTTPSTAGEIHEARSGLRTPPSAAARDIYIST